MQIPKDRILELLRERGDQEKAHQADQELPATVDTEQHADLLSKYGIDDGDLACKLPGGIGDKLGL